jgi:hypothetical protein
MMGRRLPARSGAEYDAISRWRHRRNWLHVRRSFWKRAMRRRERKAARVDVRRTHVLE